MTEKVRVCQNCHGGGQVTVWDSKAKVYVTKSCPACGGSGRIVIGNI
jgi:DnaJ-class molecular chaperone